MVIPSASLLRRNYVEAPHNTGVLIPIKINSRGRLLPWHGSDLGGELRKDRGFGVSGVTARRESIGGGCVPIAPHHDIALKS